MEAVHKTNYIFEFCLKTAQDQHVYEGIFQLLTSTFSGLILNQNVKINITIEKYFTRHTFVLNFHRVNLLGLTFTLTGNYYM